MRTPRILSRYLAGEVAQYSALATLAAVPIALVPNLLERMDELLVPGITAADLGTIAGCAAVLVTAYSLPIAFVFGALLALGRLSADGELGAVRAGGLGPASVLVPVSCVAALVSALVAALMIGVEHRAEGELTRVALRLASRGSAIEAGRFQRFGARMIYAQRRSGARRLEGVMISDWSQPERPFLIFAEEAELRFDGASGMLHLGLRNGDLRLDPAALVPHDEYRLSFDAFEYAFEAWPLGAGVWRRSPVELDLGELRDAIARAEAGEPLEDLHYQEARAYRAELHRSLALPLAPLLVGLVGVPLGLGGLIHTRARALLVALALLGAYYALFVFAHAGAVAGRLPASAAIWTPNALAAGAGLVLLRRAGR